MTLAMTAHLSTSELLSALEGVTAIPVVPYRAGSVDDAAHLKNVRYLMQSNSLSGNRPRVLSIAGTSPIHQMSRSEHVRLVDITTRAMGNEGVYVAGVLPTPLAEAKATISELAAFQRPPTPICSCRSPVSTTRTACTMSSWPLARRWTTALAHD